jgi:hypothetical protein
MREEDEGATRAAANTAISSFFFGVDFFLMITANVVLHPPDDPSVRRSPARISV